MLPEEMIANVLRHVPGTLSADSCLLLHKLAKDVPKDGLIIDLSPGEGRSTVVLAKGLEARGKEGSQVIAVDSHITNPLSERPYEDGTLLRMLTHVRTFRVQSRVLPILSGPSAVSKLFNKKSANLAVVQVSPAHTDFRQALFTGIEEAQFVIRKGGKIVMVCPNEADLEQFIFITDSMFSDDFKLVGQHTFVRIYESKGA